METRNTNYSENFEKIRHLPCKLQGTYLAVRLLPQTEKTSASGLVLSVHPDRPDLHTAVVVEVGVDCKHVKVGNLISISPVASSYTLWSKGEQLAVLQEAQVFGIYDDPDGKMTEIDWSTFGKAEAAAKMGSNGYVMD